MKESVIENIIKRAQDRAESQGLSVCITVVDDHGLLAGFFRMDGVVFGAIDISIKKARTAALFRTDSVEIGKAAQPGGPIYTLEATNGGLISFAGGVVMYGDQGKVIGGVGVSGATSEEDHDIAIFASGRV